MNDGKTFPTDTLTDEQFAAMVEAQLKPARAAQAAAAPAAAPLAPITGELTRAGTFLIRDEECTGLVISLSPDKLRAIPSLPLYRRVAVVEAGALARLQRENEHLRRLAALDALTAESQRLGLYEPNISSQPPPTPASQPASGV